MSWVLVTGASSGLGAEFCRQLAARGHSVILVARREAALRELAGKLHCDHGVNTEVVVADLSVPEDLDRVAKRLQQREKPVSLLVNNAGFTPNQSLFGADIEREKQALEVMVRAVLVLSLTAAAVMGKRGRGAILNVSSVATGTIFGAYAAHKTWVSEFSEALALDLRGSGVLVSALRPGAVRTEFFDHMDGMEVSRIPKLLLLEPEQVVREALRGLSRGQVDIVPGGLYRIVDALRSLTPRPVLRAVAAAFRRSRFLV